MLHKIGLAIPILTLKNYMALRLSVFIERCLSLVNLEVNGKSCGSVV